MERNVEGVFPPQSTKGVGKRPELPGEIWGALASNETRLVAWRSW